MTEVDEHETALGPARTHTTEADGAVRGTLVLGHGAGGGVESVDLLAVAAGAAAAGWRVIRVEQPWRVAGRRVAPAPPRLDEAWGVVLDRLRDGGRLTGPLVLGGRSAGARVACRTAAGQGADGVLALAFPLYPPGRPEKTRATELVDVTVPLLVLQGETDSMGRPSEVAAVLAGRARASVYEVPGDHSLKRNVDLVAAGALFWLGELIGRAALGR
jgi:predicted alpha/beta-hydrolase family hydrolase